jgi:hypothetical protein
MNPNQSSMPIELVEISELHLVHLTIAIDGECKVAHTFVYALT